MITNQELFINAFLEAEQITNKEYLNKGKHTFVFSQKFERKMQKLISKEDRLNFSIRRKISKGLIAAIVAIIIMLTGLMSVSASRHKIIKFTETIFDKYTQIELSNDSAHTLDTVKTAYTLGYVPDGYVLEQYNQNEACVWAIWKNESGEEIAFLQNLLDSDILIDNEHTYYTVTINGYKAYVCGKDNMYEICWNDDNYRYRLSVPAQYKDDLSVMVKNITENK